MLYQYVATVVALMSSAVRASAAVEVGQRPRREDLTTLGIDPTAFARVLRA